MAKYFKNIKNLEDLKNQFRTLARKNHPDAGGDAETMKEINFEYDALFPIWKDKHNAEQPENKTEETAASTRRHFYTANGWEGSRYNSSLSDKDIAKIVKNYTREKYPTWKFNVNSAGGGYLSHVNVSLMEAPIDIWDREYFKMPIIDGTERRRGTRVDCWDLDKMEAEGRVHVQLHRIGDREDCPYFNDVAYAVLKDVYSFMMSFNFDDSDSQTDYFSRGFYERFDIGTWKKGFRLVAKTARIKNEEASPAKAKQDAQEQGKAMEIEKKSGYTYKITQGEDTRDGSVLWVVRILETLDKAAYIAENQRMRERGGYYSRYLHGFIFRVDPSDKLTA